MLRPAPNLVHEYYGTIKKLPTADAVQDFFVVCGFLNKLPRDAASVRVGALLKIGRDSANVEFVRESKNNEKIRNRVNGRQLLIVP